ncbi:cupin domain-containing protein [Solirubrobacter ginsenosidimutans]|uniref:Cupin domain-containing protein n=1 Tax=Solirubrobacter ginsenosidimutans TaxID=490573 RepID=A0A9X3S0D9_9ACTN|nr:cupin domain-containing protein [Solirubrobacter ginsenosidimutans]MDA0159947.1 cupin domain-containing protein [Solirubrobacter ginsenosidimutans]
MRHPLNRRDLLVSGAALAAGAGGVKLASAGGAGASAAGEPPAGPDAFNPPSTDAGELPNLKFSFDAAHTRVTPGGWTRQVTVHELPVATTIAGVQMQLKPGAIRELHWHAAGEWAIMLSGSARVTAIDAQGRNFIDDVGTGDLWFFPAGLPHSIQGLKDGCEFLLVFDDGAFSEFETFLICDWFDHTPPSVLAKNFGLPESTFAHLPSEQERYIFEGVVPGPLSSDAVHSPAGTVPDSLTYRLTQQKPVSCPGGRVKIVDSSNFPASASIAAALVEVDPGGMRELHWHPNADEWQYYLDGQARMTVFGAQGTAATFDFQAGDVGSVPFPMGHYIENTGTTTLRFLELFRADRYADVSLEQWMALTPPELVAAHLNIDRATVAALPKGKQIVVRG